MTKKIKKAVFPVAGLGTRFLPATKAVPKEMLTIVDRPVIQLAVDEAREAGIEHFIFVTGRNKAVIEDHFDKQFELEASQGKRDAGAQREIDEQAKKDKGGLSGSVMVSDAFFPFRDGVGVGIKEGISAIVQPGGSDRDFDTITACNEANPKVTMVFTGQRVFKH